jgi:hypothetical protein
MINFRFHLTSLIAVFLALALGVVVGSTVIDRAVVDNLDNRIDTVERKAENIRSENGRLTTEVKRLVDVVDRLKIYAVEDELAGVEVAVIAERDVDGGALDRSVETLQTAGATVRGVLWIEGKWASRRDDDQRALAAAIDEPGRRGSGLREAAWRRLAERLAAATPPARGDLLSALDSAGFVDFDPRDGGDDQVTRFASRTSTYVLVSGDGASLPSAAFVQDGASALAGQRLRLVVADIHDPEDGRRSRGEVLSAVRDSALATTVSTVDDLDLPEGPLTLTIVVARLERGEVVHLGYGDGTVPLPEPLAAP